MKDQNFFQEIDAFGAGEIFGVGGKPALSPVGNLRFSNSRRSSLNSKRMSKGDVYYSSRPPLCPIEIVPSPDEMASEDGSNLRSSWSEGDWEMDFSSTAAWVVPVFSLDPPDPKLMAHLSYLETLYRDGMPRLPCENVTTTGTVRPILSSLLDDLPLTKSDGSPITVIENTTLGKSKDLINTISEINLEQIDVTDGEEVNMDDLAKGWMGGVRALRDSHVRLVLRQLRHVHRMNRTIDRVARAANKIKL